MQRTTDRGHTQPYPEDPKRTVDEETVVAFIEALLALHLVGRLEIQRAEKSRAGKLLTIVRSLQVPPAFFLQGREKRHRSVAGGTALRLYIRNSQRAALCCLIRSVPQLNRLTEGANYKYLGQCTSRA